MKTRMRGRIIVLALISSMVIACSSERDNQEGASVHSAQPPMAAAEAPDSGEKIAGETLSAIGGTSWRLVQIMSMDDNTYVPDNPSSYSLHFGVDGTMNVVADCNRGSGSWESESGGQLKFGLIAATMAMCPPESLHDRYMAQFQWVRSYVMRDGHLFLATMADGSIIEFEPVDDE